MDDSEDLLLRAAKGGRYTIIKLLLAPGEAGICWTQKYGRTARQLTALAGHETIVKMLEEYEECQSRHLE
jgi:ankyrin repeat protein